MSSFVLACMIGISMLLGALALFGLIWGIKNKQFEDYEKFLGGTKYDSVDALNDAYKMEQRQKNIANKQKEYRPPD